MTKFWQLDAWAKTVDIKIKPGYKIDDMIENARINLEIDHNDEEWKPGQDYIVNFLLNMATNYDDVLVELEGRLDDITWYDRDDPTDDEVEAYSDVRRTTYETIRARVHDGLKIAYPEFADEIETADKPI